MCFVHPRVFFSFYFIFFFARKSSKSSGFLWELEGNTLGIWEGEIGG